MRIIVQLNVIASVENYDTIVSYGYIPLVLLMQERIEAERRAIIIPAVGLHECRPGMALSVAEGGSPSHITDIKIIADTCRLSEPSALCTANPQA